MTPLPPSFSPITLAALAPAAAISSPVAALRPGIEPSFGRTCQVTTGKPSLPSLVMNGIDVRTRTVDGDRAEIGAGEGGLGERDRRGDVVVGRARIADDLALVAELLALGEEARLHQPMDRMVAHRLDPEQRLLRREARRGRAGDRRRRAPAPSSLNFTRHGLSSLGHVPASAGGCLLRFRLRCSPRTEVYPTSVCDLGRPRLGGALPAAAGDEEAAAQDVEADGEHHDHAHRDLLPVRVDADDDEAALDDLQEQDAGQAAGHGAGAAEQADAADHHAGDDRQLPAAADRGGAAGEIGHDEHAGDGGEHADQDEGADLVEADIDADEPRHFLVAAGGVHVAADHRAAEHEVGDHRGDDEEDEAPAEAEEGLGETERADALRQRIDRDGRR